MAPKDDESIEPAWDDLVPREHDFTFILPAALIDTWYRGPGIRSLPGQQPQHSCRLCCASTSLLGEQGTLDRSEAKFY